MYWNKVCEDIFKTNLSNFNFKTINSELDNITQSLNNTEYVSTINQRVNDNVSDIFPLYYIMLHFSVTMRTNLLELERVKGEKLKKNFIMTMNVKQNIGL
jgi:hypothetical protein